jgi:maltose alpha-D-glucosyltransferase / alpha-amylase
MRAREPIVDRDHLETWHSALCQTRWYRDKSLTLSSLELEAEIGLTESTQLTVLRLSFTEGQTALYAFPTGRDIDLTLPFLPKVAEEQAFAKDLYNLMCTSSEQLGAGGRIQGNRCDVLTLLGPEATLLNVQMSSVGFRMGETSLLKVQRRLTPGPSREAKLLAALEQENSFTSFPLLLGEVVLHLDSGESASLALLLTWLENQGDFFTWATEHDFVETAPPEAPARYRALGTHTGRLHHALARIRFPEQAPRLSELASRQHLDVAGRAERVLAQLTVCNLSTLGRQGKVMAERLLANRDGLLRLAQTATLADSTQPQQVHGDYHLGQVLLTKQGLAIVDFEGDPGLTMAEREWPRSPWVDVAGILRSIDYAAHIALDRGTSKSPNNASERCFAERARTYKSAFLDGYEQVTGHSANRDLLRTRLLDKALTELSYELSARPNWSHIPLSGILELL